MYLSLLFVVIVAYLIVERIRHEQRLKRIRTRIHVNGTRGKSSVTSLIAAALRRSGIRTLAKTTGSTPQLILPDGTTETIRRRGPASILEQFGVIRRADKLKVDAVVVECMALDPLLQFVSEKRLIQSTIGVITNVRPDHFEVMGETLDDIANALAATIPHNATLVTSDARYFATFRALASALRTQVILADAEDAIIPEAFGDHLVFRENVAIAQQVCTILGVNPAAVSESLADKGFACERTTVSTHHLGGKTIHFVDAFSANDVDSTRVIQEWAFAKEHCPQPWVALFNNRNDRPLRMNSFAKFVGTASTYQYVAIMGEGLGLAKRCFRRTLRRTALLPLDGIATEHVLSELTDRLPHSAFTVVAMGNEKGTGRLLPQAVPA